MFGNKEKIALATAIIFLAITVFFAVGQAIQNIDISVVPEPYQPLVKVLIQFFSYAPLSFAVAYWRNITGYIRNWVIEKQTEKSVYQLQKYYETVMFYLAAFNTALSALPEPYNAVAAAVVFLIDILTSEWKRMQQKLGMVTETEKPEELQYPPPIPATILSKNLLNNVEVYVDGKPYPKSPGTGCKVGHYQVLTDETKEWKTSITIAFTDYNPYEVNVLANGQSVFKGVLQYGDIIKLE